MGLSFRPQLERLADIIAPSGFVGPMPEDPTGEPVPTDPGSGSAIPSGPVVIIGGLSGTPDAPALSEVTTVLLGAASSVVLTIDPPQVPRSVIDGDPPRQPATPSPLPRPLPPPAPAGSVADVTADAAGAVILNVVLGPAEVPSDLDIGPALWYTADDAEIGGPQVDVTDAPDASGDVKPIFPPGLMPGDLPPSPTELVVDAGVAVVVAVSFAQAEPTPLELTVADAVAAVVGAVAPAPADPLEGLPPQ